MRVNVKLAVVYGVAALVVGCGGQESGDAPAVSVPQQFVSVAPEGTATPIPEARRLQPGAEVVLHGRVMGVREPFVDGRALFVLGDEATLTPCNAMAGSQCPLPWDTCCDPSEVRTAGVASIQLRGDDGRVLDVGLKGVGGLKELSRVVVAGKVAPDSSPAAFVVDASSLFVEP